MVRADLRFDVFEGAAAPGTLLFRLTARRELSVTPAELALRHGIDLDRINRDLALAVNYTRGPAFVTHQATPDGLYLRVAVPSAAGTAAFLRDVWPAVDAAAAELMRTVFSHVQHCRCGF